MRVAAGRLRDVAACMTMLAACGSDPVAPTLRELQGEWIMSWTESGPQVVCEWSEVTLSLRDPAKGLFGLWGGGRGTCRGLVDSDNLVLVNFVIDSLTQTRDRIRFIPLGSTYRFEGRVSGDQMEGRMSASPFYEDAGVQVQTAGRWRAVRVVDP